MLRTHKELADLDELCKRLKGNLGDYPSNLLDMRVYQSVNRFKTSSSPTIQALLSRCWLRSIECLMNDNKSLHWSPLDEFVSFVTSKNTVAHLASDDYNATALACVCISSVRYSNDSYVCDPVKDHVGDLMRQWLGPDIDEKHWENLEAIVDYFYGAHAIDVYQEDDDADKLARTLLRARVPMRLGKEQDINSGILSLPNDINI